MKVRNRGGDVKPITHSYIGLYFDMFRNIAPPPPHPVKIWEKVIIGKIFKFLLT